MSKPSDLVQGALSQVLHKLEQQGCKPSKNNRPVRFYSLTRPGGRKYLEKETASWDRLSQAITAVTRMEEA